MADCGDDVFAPDSEDWGEQIRCLRIEIEGLRKEIQGATRDQGSFNSKLGDSFNLYKSIGASVNSLKKDMKDFTTNAQRQYDLAEKIAKSYKQASLNIGLSVGKSSEFNNVFKKSVAEIAKFGGTVEDAQGIYEDFADSSGRVRILGDDEVSSIFQLSKAANLVGSEAASLYETLDLMGVSNVDATERLEQLVIDSQSVGLNSSKVVKTLSNNMNKMQTYSFSSGVKGMTKMAKLAVSMRMDVGEMLGMADKFYQPEAAIEAAANLQMLGGDIANAFGDPFETMYLARNKPEELAEKVSSMVEGMMTFNEETGQYDFPAEARMQLEAAGDQLGINVDSMIEMTRQSTKISDVKKKLSMTGAFSDKEMEGIANMARMEGGEFKVDMYDEDGQKLTKSIDELNSSDVEMLMKSPQGEEDYMEKMIDNSMTSNELLAAINDSFQKTFVGGSDMYKLYEEGSKETIQAVRDMTVKSTTASIDIMRDTLVGEMATMGVDSIESLDKNMAEAIKGMGSFIEGGDGFNIDSDTIDVQTGITNVNNSGDANTAASDKNLSKTPKEICIGKGGVLDSNGKCIKDGKEVPLAKGGIVTKPTSALIGEGGESEAVLPLSKLDSMIGNSNKSEMKVSGTATINVNINSNTAISSNMESQLTSKIIEVYQKIANGDGDPSSVFQSQPSKGSEILYT
jgi:hypothetical protein